MTSVGGSPEVPARAERKGERTRRRILEAARRVFAEVGYERATIRAIATAAEVDKSSVMQYFGPTTLPSPQCSNSAITDLQEATVEHSPEASRHAAPPAQAHSHQ